MTRPSALLSVSKLVSKLRDPSVSNKLRFIDASWHMPAAKRDPFHEFKTCRIPGAGFLDIDKVADLSHDVPHMLPPPKTFAEAMSKMGINSTDEIVVYDTVGTMSSPRTWWALRAMGHTRVSVLDGGLPAWHDFSNNALPVVSDDWDGKAHTVAIKDGEFVVNIDEEGRDGDFEATLDSSMVRSKQDIIDNCSAEAPFTIGDARAPAGRFNGTLPEPRAGMPNGHMPHSKCLPWNNMMQTDEKTHIMTLRPVDELKAEFAKAEIDLTEKGLTFSCGSGLTACVLALAAHECGRADAAVYDGSWTEWASDPDTKKLDSMMT